MKKITQPLTVFLIGATGDLAKKKIFKALYQLHVQRALPEQFRIIGNARKDFSRQEFQEFVKSHTLSHAFDPNWDSFEERLHFVSGDVTELKTFEKLKTFHEKIKNCGNHLWYVATLPSLYTPIISNIKAVSLQNANCGWTKFLLEKPFGTDLDSSRKLNEELLQVFSEDQIYRIDHFLAKETVQNLLVFRFGNGIFEHLWNSRFVDHIQVTSSETLGVAGRESFYDGTGVVRDVVQNHVIQMLAMTLMEEPKHFTPEEMRVNRNALLSSLSLMNEKDVASHAAFGQYGAGVVDGKSVLGYREEHEKLKNSNTETAVALRVTSNTDRWRGVPIYIRAGKRLARSVTEISIIFKEPSNTMFFDERIPQKGNVLTLRIQPNEGVILRLHVKEPGLKIQMTEVPMSFCYHTAFAMDLVEAYQKLIFDAVSGDPTLFPQARDINASWKIMEPLLKFINSPEYAPEPYPAGSWGPPSFDQLIQKEGRSWIEPSPNICIPNF